MLRSAHATALIHTTWWRKQVADVLLAPFKAQHSFPQPVQCSSGGAARRDSGRLSGRWPGGGLLAGWPACLGSTHGWAGLPKPLLSKPAALHSAAQIHSYSGAHLSTKHSSRQWGHTQQRLSAQHTGFMQTHLRGACCHLTASLHTSAPSLLASDQHGLEGGQGGAAASAQAGGGAATGDSNECASWRGAGVSEGSRDDAGPPYKRSPPAHQPPTASSHEHPTPPSMHSMHAPADPAATPAAADRANAGAARTITSLDLNSMFLLLRHWSQQAPHELPPAHALLAAAQRVPQLLSHLRTSPFRTSRTQPQGPSPRARMLRSSLRLQADAASGLHTADPQQQQQQQQEDVLVSTGRNGRLLGEYMGVAAGASGGQLMTQIGHLLVSLLEQRAAATLGSSVHSSEHSGEGGVGSGQAGSQGDAAGSAASAHSSEHSGAGGGLRASEGDAAGSASRAQAAEAVLAPMTQYLGAAAGMQYCLDARLASRVVDLLAARYDVAPLVQVIAADSPHFLALCSALWALPSGSFDAHGQAMLRDLLQPQLSCLRTERLLAGATQSWLHATQLPYPSTAPEITDGATLASVLVPHALGSLQSATQGSHGPEHSVCEPKLTYLVQGTEGVELLPGVRCIGCGQLGHSADICPGTGNRARSSNQPLSAATPCLFSGAAPHARLPDLRLLVPSITLLAHLQQHSKHSTIEHRLWSAAAVAAHAATRTPPPTTTAPSEAAHAVSSSPPPPAAPPPPPPGTAPAALHCSTHAALWVALAHVCCAEGPAALVLLRCAVAAGSAAHAARQHVHTPGSTNVVTVAGTGPTERVVLDKQAATAQALGAVMCACERGVSVEQALGELLFPEGGEGGGGEPVGERVHGGGEEGVGGAGDGASAASTGVASTSPAPAADSAQPLFEHEPARAGPPPASGEGAHNDPHTHPPQPVLQQQQQQAHDWTQSFSHDQHGVILAAKEHLADQGALDLLHLLPSAPIEEEAARACVAQLLPLAVCQLAAGLSGVGGAGVERVGDNVQQQQRQQQQQQQQGEGVREGQFAQQQWQQQPGGSVQAAKQQQVLQDEEQVAQMQRLRAKVSPASTGVRALLSLAHLERRLQETRGPNGHVLHALIAQMRLSAACSSPAAAEHGVGGHRGLRGTCTSSGAQSKELCVAEMLSTGCNPHALPTLLGAVDDVLLEEGWISKANLHELAGMAESLVLLGPACGDTLVEIAHLAVAKSRIADAPAAAVTRLAVALSKAPLPSPLKQQLLESAASCVLRNSPAPSLHGAHTGSQRQLSSSNHSKRTLASSNPSSAQQFNRSVSSSTNTTPTTATIALPSFDPTASGPVHAAATMSSRLQALHAQHSTQQPQEHHQHLSQLFALVQASLDAGYTPAVLLQEFVGGQRSAQLLQQCSTAHLSKLVHLFRMEGCFAPALASKVLSRSLSGSGLVVCGDVGPLVELLAQCATWHQQVQQVVSLLTGCKDSPLSIWGKPSLQRFVHRLPGAAKNIWIKNRKQLLTWMEEAPTNLACKLADSVLPGNPFRCDVGASLRKHFWVAHAAWEGSSSTPDAGQLQQQGQPMDSISQKARGLVARGGVSTLGDDWPLLVSSLGRLGALDSASRSALASFGARHLHGHTQGTDFTRLSLAVNALEHLLEENAGLVAMSVGQAQDAWDKVAAAVLTCPPSQRLHWLGCLAALRKSSPERYTQLLHTFLQHTLDSSALQQQLSPRTWQELLALCLDLQPQNTSPHLHEQPSAAQCCLSPLIDQHTLSLLVSHLARAQQAAEEAAPHKPAHSLADLRTADIGILHFPPTTGPSTGPGTAACDPSTSRPHPPTLPIPPDLPPIIPLPPSSATPPARGPVTAAAQDAYDPSLSAALLARLTLLEGSPGGPGVLQLALQVGAHRGLPLFLFGNSHSSHSRSSSTSTSTSTSVVSTTSSPSPSTSSTSTSSSSTNHNSSSDGVRGWSPTNADVHAQLHDLGVSVRQLCAHANSTPSAAAQLSAACMADTGVCLAAGPLLTRALVQVPHLAAHNPHMHLMLRAVTRWHRLHQAIAQQHGTEHQQYAPQLLNTEAGPQGLLAWGGAGPLAPEQLQQLHSQYGLMSRHFALCVAQSTHLQDALKDCSLKQANPEATSLLALDALELQAHVLSLLSKQLTPTASTDAARHSSAKSSSSSSAARSGSVPFSSMPPHNSWWLCAAERLLPCVPLLGVEDLGRLSHAARTLQQHTEAAAAAAAVQPQASQAAVNGSHAPTKSTTPAAAAAEDSAVLSARTVSALEALRVQAALHSCSLLATDATSRLHKHSFQHTAQYKHTPTSPSTAQHKPHLDSTPHQTPAPSVPSSKSDTPKHWSHSPAQDLRTPPSYPPAHPRPTAWANQLAADLSCALSQQHACSLSCAAEPLLGLVPRLADVLPYLQGHQPTQGPQVSSAQPPPSRHHHHHHHHQQQQQQQQHASSKLQNAGSKLGGGSHPPSPHQVSASGLPPPPSSHLAQLSPPPPHILKQLLCSSLTAATRALEGRLVCAQLPGIAGQGVKSAHAGGGNNFSGAPHSLEQASGTQQQQGPQHHNQQQQQGHQHHEQQQQQQQQLPPMGAITEAVARAADLSQGVSSTQQHTPALLQAAADACLAQLHGMHAQLMQNKAFPGQQQQQLPFGPSTFLPSVNKLLAAFAAHQVWPQDIVNKACDIVALLNGDTLKAERGDFLQPWLRPEWGEPPFLPEMPHPRVPVTHVLEFLSKVAASQHFSPMAAHFMRYAAERYILHYYKPAGTVVRVPSAAREPIISLALRPGAPHPKDVLLPWLRLFDDDLILGLPTASVTLKQMLHARESVHDASNYHLSCLQQLSDDELMDAAEAVARSKHWRGSRDPYLWFLCLEYMVPMELHRRAVAAHTQGHKRLPLDVRAARVLLSLSLRAPAHQQSEDLWGIQLQHLMHGLEHFDGPSLAQLVHFLGTQHAQLTQGVGNRASWQLSQQLFSRRGAIVASRAPRRLHQPLLHSQELQQLQVQQTHMKQQLTRMWLGKQAPAPPAPQHHLPQEPQPTLHPHRDHSHPHQHRVSSSTAAAATAAAAAAALAPTTPPPTLLPTLLHHLSTHLHHTHTTCTQLPWAVWCPVWLALSSMHQTLEVWLQESLPPAPSTTLSGLPLHRQLQMSRLQQLQHAQQHQLQHAQQQQQQHGTVQQLHVPDQARALQACLQQVSALQGVILEGLPRLTHYLRVLNRGGKEGKRGAKWSQTQGGYGSAGGQGQGHAGVPGVSAMAGIDFSKHPPSPGDAIQRALDAMGPASQPDRLPQLMLCLALYAHATPVKRREAVLLDGFACALSEELTGEAQR